MKNNKKKLLILLFLTLVLLLSSCGNNTNFIIGNWKCDNVFYGSNYTFSDDGSFYESGMKIKGTYTLSDNKITFVSGKITHEYFVKSKSNYVSFYEDKDNKELDFTLSKIK